MKLSLILCDQEVEMIENISLPLNKTYENLYNPTDIIVDSSRSINIPMTSKNNMILANSYRLDRNILSGDNSQMNIGLHLDPTKKIPMKLLYNSSVVLEGYAKFVSANNSTNNKYYTLNLFGVLGDIFQKLKSVVVSENQLTDDQKSESDGGAKYILYNTPAPITYLNADYIKSCWNVENNGFVGLRTRSDVIGFAPSYRGKYNNFESSKIEVYDITNGGSKIIPLSEYVNTKWTETYNENNPGVSESFVQDTIEALDSESLVGDGMTDHQMREYRSYMLKPYIFLNQLLQLFQVQITQLSDYTLELDTNWFNANNPYWTKICYMLDFLDNKDGNEDVDLQITEAEDLPKTFAGPRSVSCELSSSILDDYIKSTSTVSIRPVDVNISISGFGPTGEDVNPLILYSFPLGAHPEITMTFNKETYFIIKTTCRNRLGGSSLTNNVYCSFEDFSVAKQFIKESDLLESNYIKLENSQRKTTAQINGWDEFLETKDLALLQAIYTTSFNVSLPAMGFTFTTNNTAGINITRTVTIKNVNNFVPLNITYYSPGLNAPSYQGEVTYVHLADNPFYKVSYNSLYVNKSWRDNIEVNLKSIYFKEDSPLFDIILQYTKMFGLIWVPDYNSKTIKLLHKYTHFKDYVIEDWSDKLDRNEDFIIEPVTFNKKYVTFEYEDVDGYRYSGYRDKYGLNYGGKIINTGYDFGTERDNLFSNISPSCASSKVFLTMKDIEDWDLSSVLISQPDKHSYIDCEDGDGESAISIYNWYLRGENKTLDVPVRITDDTALQKASNEFCWLDETMSSTSGVTVDSIPTFNIAVNYEHSFPHMVGQTINCVFNTPKEDYTSSQVIADSLGNSIYDQFWNNYITERYSIQNKKVTAYFNISPVDYMNFSFNKFISVDNQLFMVNKIFDYDINAKGLTKVELVQITNTDVYINGSRRFPPIVVSPDSLTIYGSLQSSYDGSFNLTAQITLPNIDERGEWGELQGRLTMYRGTPVTAEDVDTNQDLATDNYVFIEYGDWQGEIGRDVMVLYWVDMDGNKFEGSITYTVGGEVFEIPIIIDYTI